MTRILSVFNNISSVNRVKNSWGLSFFIASGAEKILFDTGPDGNLLLHNLKGLNINPAEIKKLIISHKHPDHRGGLGHILEAYKGNIELYLPSSFAAAETEKIAPYCRDLRVISREKERIVNNIYSSGTMGNFVKEQALVIDLPQGLVLIAGCGHPGIARMCRHVMRSFSKNIYALLGGFHLEYYPGFAIKGLYNALKDMGIKKIGPGHCSGEKAFLLLKRDFGDEFVDLSLGKEIVIG